MTSTAPAVTVDGLTKRYGKRLAVDDLTAEIPRGAVTGSAVSDYGAVLVWLTGYAVLAMMVAILVRSLPLAIAVGVAWAGPAEHLIGGAWAPGERFFPGLLLENFAQGGTADVTATRALLTITVYVLISAGLTLTIFSRRDVSG